MLMGATTCRCFRWEISTSRTYLEFVRSLENFHISTVRGVILDKVTDKVNDKETHEMLNVDSGFGSPPV